MEGKNHTGGIILKDMGEHRKLQIISEPTPATVDETTTTTTSTTSTTTTKVRGLNEEVVAKERHPRDTTEKVIIRIDNYNNYNNNKHLSKENDKDKDKEWESKKERESEKEKAKKKKDKEESPRDWKQMMKSPLR